MLHNPNQSVDPPIGYSAYGAPHRVNGATSPVSRLQLLTFDNIQAATSSPYLIKGWLNEGEMSVMIGEPGCGKSFLATDISFHLARGIEWRGFRVRRCGVLYLAAEGGNGIVNRVTALRQHHGIDDDETYGTPFGVVNCPLDLYSPSGHTQDVIALVRDAADKLGLPVDFIVVDTLSRALSGADENSPEGMGTFLKNIDAIRHDTSAHVLTVHHVGKDASRGGRGHSSLKGAVDTEIEVLRDAATKVATATVTKQRNGPVGSTFSFKLDLINLAIDQDGDPITSCIVTAVDPPPTDSSRPTLPAPQQIALSALREAITAGGDLMPASNHIPPGAMTVHADLWREYAYARSIAAAGTTQDAKQKAFRRASQELQRRGFVGCWQDRVWIVDAPG